MARNFRNYRILWLASLWFLFATPKLILAQACHLQAETKFKEIQHLTNLSADLAINDAKRDSLDHKIDTHIKELMEMSCDSDSASTKYAKVLYDVAAYYHRYRKYDLSIDFYSKTLSIRKSVFSPAHPDLIRCYANICRGNRLNYTFEAGEDAILKGLEEIKKGQNTWTNEDSVARGYFYWQSAQLFIQMEDLYMALKLSTLAWNIYTSLNNYILSLYAGNQLGVIYNKLEDHESGIPHLLKVEQLYEPERRFGDLHKLYQNIANIYLRADSFNQAIDYYNKAINEAKIRQDDIVESDCVSNLGILYRRKGQLSQSIFLQSEAIELDMEDSKINSSSGRVRLSRRFDCMGDVYQDSSFYDSALTYYQKAVNLIVRDYENEDPYSLPNYETLSVIGPYKHLITNLSSKAKSFHSKYQQTHNQKDLEAAKNTYVYVLNLIDDLRTSFKEDKSKLELIESLYEAYEGAIEVAVAMDNPALAFQFSEKSKATLMNEYLMDREAKYFAKIPNASLQKEQDLKRNIALLEQKLAGYTLDDTEYQSLLNEISIQENELNLLIKSFEKDYPDYYRLKYDTEQIDVEALQNSLPDSTLLIEYFAGEENWFIFGLTRREIIVKEVPRDRDPLLAYARLLTETKNWITNWDNQQKRDFLNLGNEVYQQLIQPVEHMLTKYVLVIPDGEVYYLPIDALLYEKADPQTPVSKLPFLLNNIAVAQSFSAKHWLKISNSQNTSATFQRNLLGFAPDFSPLTPAEVAIVERQFLNLPFFQNRPEPESMEELIPLVETQDELEKVRDLLGGMIYPDGESNGLLGRFIAEASKYRFIHLATHGIFNPINSRYSYLAFTPVADTIDNERLYLADLFGLDLNAEMIVLSACQTQVGEWLPGEGLASLAQGFSYAGARSIVATLWSVQNKSNAELMKAYYEFLSNGHNKASALQQAKLRLHEAGTSTGAPYFWAAPVVIGDISPIKTSSYLQRYILPLIGVLVLLGLVIWLIMRARKRQKASAV